MNNLEKSLIAFEKLMVQLSDEKLDTLISKIDDKGIVGPSVDEYFSKLNASIGSFFNDSALYTFNDNLLTPINSLDALINAEKIVLNNYSFDDITTVMAGGIVVKDEKLPYAAFISGSELLQSLLKTTAGESTYAMAA